MPLAGAKAAPRRAAARMVKAEAPAAELPALQASGKLTIRKRRTASVAGRSTRSKSAAQTAEARGIGLDVPYEWGNPETTER
jgi:hypothetical protein